MDDSPPPAEPPIGEQLQPCTFSSILVLSILHEHPLQIPNLIPPPTSTAWSSTRYSTFSSASNVESVSIRKDSTFTPQIFMKTSKSPNPKATPSSQSFHGHGQTWFISHSLPKNRLSPSTGSKWPKRGTRCAITVAVAMQALMTTTSLHRRSYHIIAKRINQTPPTAHFLSLRLRRLGTIDPRDGFRFAPLFLQLLLRHHGYITRP